MQKSYSFTVLGEPIAQPRPRITVRGGHGHGYVPASHAIHGYRAAVVCAWRNSQAKPIASPAPVLVRIVAMMPRPKSMTWVKRLMPQVWHTKRPDAENIGKGVLDALTKYAWTDDSQVCDFSIVKRICAGDESPCTEITITQLRG